MDGVEYYKLYMVPREQLESCTVTKADTPLLNCVKPDQDVKFTLKFQEFSPNLWGLEFFRGKDYYIICKYGCGYERLRPLERRSGQLRWLFCQIDVVYLALVNVVFICVGNDTLLRGSYMLVSSRVPEKCNFMKCYRKTHKHIIFVVYRFACGMSFHICQNNNCTPGFYTLLICNTHIHIHTRFRLKASFMNTAG